MDRRNTILELMETMEVAKRSMRAKMQPVFAGCPVSHAQLELLYTIDHRQPINSKQLAAKLQLTPGAISQLLDELDKQSLIERETDPADRRRQVLRTSAKGRDVLRIINKRRRQFMESIIEDLTDDELAAWLKIQQKMIQKFQTYHHTQTPQKG